MKKLTLGFLILGLLLITIFSLIVIKTRIDLNPNVGSLNSFNENIRKLQILDRYGVSLNITFQNRWNVHDEISLHEIPEFLKISFILSEDKRFFDHDGVDWKARLHATWSNFKALRIVRGASTITEQSVRMLNPRPRTFWSRWLEGWEANLMENDFSKEEIFEFYLNQVPYAANRRGVAQAARYYFNRDLDTLTRKEMLALVVLVRAPSALNLHNDPTSLEGSIERLTQILVSNKLIRQFDVDQILQEKFYLEKPSISIQASHFARHVLTNQPHHLSTNRSKVRTTLDGGIQLRVQSLLDQRLKHLRTKNNVQNGSVLVVDHINGEIIAWAVGNSEEIKIPGRSFDAITTPRQPGSTLKPFLYALALDSGWSSETIIKDKPLTSQIGFGMHRYKNYSRLFYGPVTVKEALGNSLNIPALRTAQFVGGERYLSSLRRLGFLGLNQRADFYGDGLALGNGEVTLLELVQAYTALARHGEFIKLSMLMDDTSDRKTDRIFTSATSSEIAGILSDPSARQLEFGGSGALNFPVQTSVKTGTSSDYRDAWAVGFNYRYTVGSWMGNLDRQPTKGLTGASGPALLLRGIFAELNKNKETQPLISDSQYSPNENCLSDGTIQESTNACTGKMERPKTHNSQSDFKITTAHIVQPTDGLHLAMDPRIPDDQEAFQFRVDGLNKGEIVNWIVDDNEVGTSSEGKHLWLLKKGKHQVRAAIYQNQRPVYETREIAFLVK
ncbi:MAG: transglycosylase domain-containing protein [Nitrospinales bacterium]